MTVLTVSGANSGEMQAIMLGGATVVVAYDGSVQSAVIAAEMVRLVATTDCHVAVGTNPTATTSSMLLPAGVPEYFALLPDQRIAAIKASGAAAGSLYITAAL